MVVVTVTAVTGIFVVVVIAVVVTLKAVTGIVVVVVIALVLILMRVFTASWLNELSSAPLGGVH